MSGRLLTPLVQLAELDMAEVNACLVRWGHEMGPCKRPNGQLWGHALFEDFRPVAVTVTSSLVRETCAGLPRTEAVELARLCADRPTLCRVMLRMWREFVFPRFAWDYGWRWAVSYQDEALHTGATYRNDGWQPLGRSRSGTDSRSGRQGRNKTIWGYQMPHAAALGRVA